MTNTVAKKHKKNRFNFLAKVIKNGVVVQRHETHFKRRFYKQLRSINWQDSPLKVYLRVSYGKAMTIQGKLETFYNDGHYENEEDLRAALSMFIA